MKKKIILFSVSIVLVLVALCWLFFVDSSEKEIFISSDQNNQYQYNIREFKNNPETAVTITFVGDIMVDRFIRQIAERNSYDYLFDQVRDVLNQSDLVVANLEGTVTNFPSISNSAVPHERFVFTFNPKIISALLKSNIKIVTIDNNHILDFGQEGINQTRKYLDDSTLDYFGDTYNREILYKKFGDITIGFISYNQFIEPNVAETNRLIKEAKKEADHVIVYSHWGDEYEIEPNKHQIQLAHQFIDNGADLIIGAHPHVVQYKEIYENRRIYYSLGNFIFDQYFSDEVSCGAVVTFEFTKNDIKLISEKFVQLDSKKVVQFSDCQQKNTNLIRN